MIDFSVLMQNLITVLAVGFIGWIVYQRVNGKKSNSLFNLKEKLGRMTMRSKLK